MNFIQKSIIKMFNLQDGSVPTGVPTGASDNWTPPASYPWDWFQKNLSTDDYTTNTVVEACVKTISETVAMLPVHHYRKNDTGGANIIETSSASRILRKPNKFQTKSDFFLNFTRGILLNGNGYAVATRNNRFEIDALYPQTKMHPYISPDLKDVYYSMGSNELIDLDSFIPSRNVLHTRLHTGSHPLIGITPLEACVISAATGTSIQGHTNRFFTNMARPSGVLTTDMTLTKEQTSELRKRWNEQAQGMNSGNTPILTSGMKYSAVTMTAVDAEILGTYNMTKSDIASIYRVPLPLLGSMENSTFNNVESLMKHWVSLGLGFMLDHIENSLNELFDLPNGEYINFDTDYLQRSDFKSRMDGYKVAVTGGFMTPNEARRKEGFDEKDGGDSLFMQTQNTPIDLNSKRLEADIASTEANTEQIGKEPETVDDISADEAKEIGSRIANIKGLDI